MKSSSAILLSAAVACAVCAAQSCSRGSGKPAADERPAVEVARPTVDSVVLRKTYPGYLSASREVDLVARVDGYLLSHPYKAGDRVRRGDVLFTIEDGNYRDAVDRADAALQTARAALDYNSSRYSAMQRALSSDAVSEMEVTQARSAMEQARADVESATAALRTARTQLSYCTVRAPFDGRISSVLYDIGAYLSGSAQPVALAKIYDDATMLVNFAIDDAAYLNMMQSATEQLGIDMRHIPLAFSDTLPGSYTCDLSYMAPSVDKSTGTLNMQGTTDNPRGELRSGMYTEISLPYDVEPHALLILDAAVGSDQLGSYVYTVNDSDRVVYTPVRLGESVADSLRIVTSGLDASDRYVTRALLKVRDGMEVKPVLRGNNSTRATR